jgi:hypothetical protein
MCLLTSFMATQPALAGVILCIVTGGLLMLG